MSLEAWALSALQKQPVYYEDVGNPDKGPQLEMIAKAIAQSAREVRGWRWSQQRLIAIEIAIEENETHSSLRIHRNECNLKKHECDSGKAISLFQLHAKPLSSPDVWPRLGFMTFESTLLSAKEAARVIVRAQGLCANAPGDPIALVFTAYAGHGCQLDKWEGWKPRLATYNRVMRVPVPKADSQKQAD